MSMRSKKRKLFPCGVYDSSYAKNIAKVSAGGKSYHLGTFKTPTEVLDVIFKFKNTEPIKTLQKKKNEYVCHDCQQPFASKCVYEYHINNYVCRMQLHRAAYQLATTAPQREQASEDLKNTKAKREERKKDKAAAKKEKMLQKKKNEYVCHDYQHRFSKRIGYEYHIDKSVCIIQKQRKKKEDKEAAVR